MDEYIVKQELIILSAKQRGFHLVTHEILEKTSLFVPLVAPSINGDRTEKSLQGILHIMLLHTSASLSLNENADPTVRKDFETFSNALVPDNTPSFIHTYEGADDMPAHIKSSMYGTSLSIPVHNSSLVLGTWQGIYFNEHRNYGGKRKIYLTFMGISQ